MELEACHSSLAKPIKSRRKRERSGSIECRVVADDGNLAIQFERLLFPNTLPCESEYNLGIEVSSVRKRLESP